MRNIKTNIDREKLVSLMSNKLQILRLKVDVSQEELADILGVTRQTISALETGQRNMSWTIFLALVLLFLKNKDTKHLMIALGIYTKELNEYLSLWKEYQSNEYKSLLEDFLFVYVKIQTIKKRIDLVKIAIKNYQNQ